MSGSVRLDRQLADRLHRPLGISAVTCNIVQANTSSVHHFGLPRVSVCDVGQVVSKKLTRADRFLKILDSTLLACEAVTLLVMQPTKLLKDLCMVWVTFQNTHVCRFGVVVL